MSSDIIDLQAASALSRYKFTLKGKTAGPKLGIRRTNHQGSGIDFLEYRPYSQGDDLRRVDWRLFGRSDRLYLKNFEDEMNQRWCILVDSSGSMGFGSGGFGSGGSSSGGPGSGQLSKLDYAKTLAATLAYLLVKQGDTVSLGSFSGEGLNLNPAKSSIPALMESLEEFVSAAPIGSTDFSAPILKALNVSKKNTCFVIISDFLVPLEQLSTPLKTLGWAGAKSIMFHTLDPEEKNFNLDGSLELVDMEDGRRVRVESTEAKTRYRERMGEFCAELQSHCFSCGLNYILTLTDSPIGSALLKIARR